jgi:hypothetical protein
MTLNNKNTTLAAIVLFSVVMTSAVSLQDALGQITSTTNGTVISNEVTDEFLLGSTPSKLSDKDMAEYKNIIVNNNEVKAIMGNAPYKFGPVGFLGNIYHPNYTWYPEIHVTVEGKSNLNKDIAIVFDPATKSVINIQTVEYDATDKNDGGIDNAFAVQRFSGNSGTPDGIKVNATAPTFTWDQTTRTRGNVLMLNGLMLGSSWANACSSGSVPSTYWAQIGFYWKDSGKINWDDTANNCTPTFTTLSYVAGKNYQFRIVGATSGWAYYAIRSDTGATWTTRGPAVNSSQMNVSTGNDGTSVFFENKYLSTDPSWYGQFGSSPQASQAQYKTSPFGSYSNWSSTARSDEDCHLVNHYYPYNSTKEVMSGNLASGGSATWSMSKMQTYYPKC